MLGIEPSFTDYFTDSLNDDVVLVVDEVQKKIFQIPISTSTQHSQNVLPIGEYRTTDLHFVSKSNLHYTRDITPKRVTSGGAHFRGLAPGLHSSEGTLQRWRAVGGIVLI